MNTKNTTPKSKLHQVILLLLMTFLTANNFAIAKHLGEHNENAKTAISATKTSDLAQNYPNPFKQETTIEYKMSQKNGSIIVFDLLGKSVATFQLDKKQGEVVLDKDLDAGMYFYSLIENDEVVATKRMNVTY
jgi:hypothetical protein